MFFWRLSNTLDARLYMDALSQALQRYGRPETFNSDQGRQFTSLDFTSVLTDPRVVIFIDGRGRCMDNILIERLWRSLKYEAVYHHERQPHFALGGSTPADAYENGMLKQTPAQHRCSPPVPPERQPMLDKTPVA